MILEFTCVDTGKVYLAADLVAAICEPSGEVRARGVGSVIGLRKPIGGNVIGFNAVEAAGDINARWRIALGLKGGTL